MAFNFDRNLVIIGHLQADLRKAEQRLIKQERSIRAYKGHKTRRIKKTVKIC